MSKRIFTAVAAGLLLASSAGAYAAEGYNYYQNGNQARNVPAPIQSPEQGAGKVGTARRFYSYQAPPARGQRFVVQPFVRPASAKALGNY
jgi:hypothetical protein